MLRRPRPVAPVVAIRGAEEAAASVECSTKARRERRRVFLMVQLLGSQNASV